MMMSKKENKIYTTIFVDIASAYNTVDRKILFRHMREKAMMDQYELDFLEYIQENIYFQTQKK
jgi:hypothetical protein